MMGPHRYESPVQAQSVSPFPSHIQLWGSQETLQVECISKHTPSPLAACKGPEDVYIKKLKTIKILSATGKNK